MSYKDLKGYGIIMKEQEIENESRAITSRGKVSFLTENLGMKHHVEWPTKLRCY